MIFVGVAFLLPIWILSFLLNKKINDKFNPTSIIVYIWSFLLLLSICFGKSTGLYPMNGGGIFAFCFFLFLVVSFSYLFTFNIERKNSKSINLENLPDLFKLCIVLFMLCLISRLLYFKDLNNLIPLNSLFENIWLWKNYVLSGKINESSLKYLGYNLNVTGALLSLCFYQQKELGYTKKRNIILVMIFLYLILSFLNVRRDPMIIKLVYLLYPIIIYNKHNFKKIMRYILPVIIVFFTLLIVINTKLSFKTLNVSRSIASYSYGAFNSLQKAYDMGYPSNTNLPLANTFYFIYMFLKYISGKFAPPTIVLDSMGLDTTNVYTSLIAPLIDSAGSKAMFYFILFFYSLFIALVNMIVYRWYVKKGSLASLLMFCTVVSCSIRSFYNPVYSYSDLIFGLLYAAVFGFVLKNKACSSKMKKIPEKHNE